MKGEKIKADEVAEKWYKRGRKCERDGRCEDRESKRKKMRRKRGGHEERGK